MTTTNTPDLHEYDLIVINTSGGKDSQTMLHQVVELADSVEYPREKIIAVHADLGRVEWAGTAELAEEQVNMYGLEFFKISRERGDLLDQVEARGMWPSNTNRYCTSDQKRDQISKIITALGKRWRDAGGAGNFWVLNCMGIRAEESSARAKKLAFEHNTRASNKSRTVDNWLPIFDMLETEVWQSIRESGVPHSPAYDLGMPRLSCVFCIFAPKPALILAGKHNRKLLDQYVEIEDKIEHTFRQDMSIRSIRDAVIADAPIEEMSGNWNM